MHMLQYCQLINLFLAKMFMLNQLEFFLRGKRDLYYSRAKKVLPTQARDIVRAGAEPDHSTVLRPSKVRQRMAYIILLSRNMNNMTLPFTHKMLHFRDHHGILRAVLS